MANYYDVLGVTKDASQSDIQAAFRRLARQFHPDANNGVDIGGRMAEITEANEVLSNSGRRVEYDQQESRTEPGGMGGRDSQNPILTNKLPEFPVGNGGRLAHIPITANAPRPSTLSSDEKKKDLDLEKQLADARRSEYLRGRINEHKKYIDEAEESLAELERWKIEREASGHHVDPGYYESEVAKINERIGWYGKAIGEARAERKALKGQVGEQIATKETSIESSSEIGGEVSQAGDPGADEANLGSVQ